MVFHKFRYRLPQIPLKHLPFTEIDCYGRSHHPYSEEVAGPRGQIRKAQENNVTVNGRPCMPIDKNELYKEVSMQICSSLDFSHALENARQYLSQIIPLDGLFFNLYEKEKKAMRTIICTTRSGRRNNIITPLNAEAIAFLETTRKKPGPSVGYFKHPSDHVMTMLEAPSLGYEDQSGMAMRLHIDNRILGTLIATARLGTEFATEHHELIESLHKPFTIALLNAMSHEELTKRKNELADDNEFLTHELKAYQKNIIIGADSGLKNVMEMVAQVAPLNNTVLLMGETGTGKEIIANAIHQSSQRCDGPLIKVNCGAIPENLVDSELFGHEKGAFTGAANRNRGRFERAHGGTIFLDEIGELPLAAQTRLLRVLQSKEIERIGGSETVPVDIRVIAATHRKLEHMVLENKFREDLWFRLNVFPIIIPPLRQRTEDISLLIQYFLKQKAQEMGLRTPPEIADGALEQLKNHNWPGNVRELENVIERALIQNRGRTQPLDLFAFAPSTPILPSELSDRSKCIFPCLAKQSGDDVLSKGDDGRPLTLDETMARQIEETLKLTLGRINGPGGAADILGVNPSTLRNRMNKLNIVYGKTAEASNGHNVPD